MTEIPWTILLRTRNRVAEKIVGEALNLGVAYHFLYHETDDNTELSGAGVPELMALFSALEKTGAMVEQISHASARSDYYRNKDVDNYMLEQHE